MKYAFNTVIKNARRFKQEGGKILKKLPLSIAFVILILSVAYGSMIPVDLPGIGQTRERGFQKSLLSPRDASNLIYDAPGNLLGSVRNWGLRIFRISLGTLRGEFPPASAKAFANKSQKSSFTLVEDDLMVGNWKQSRLDSGPESPLPLLSMGIFLAFGLLGLALLGFRRKRV